MSDYFRGIAPIEFKGPRSDDPLSFRYYEADRVVMGKPMRDQLRMAVCYWHNFVWPGTDPFGGPTFLRPWFGDDLEHARAKADAAFEMFRILGVPFFTFHDRDIAPEGASLTESEHNVRAMGEMIGSKMQDAGIALLWGTANLFSHRRYMAGAATNPDPDVFAYAVAQVRCALDVTHDLGGANYVLWGGREGYETLLNTNLAREIEQAGRFLSLVVEYKHKIGFPGTILIEPKPQEPTKHQYDYDVATVFGFLQRFGLEREVKVNIETGHAVLAGHSFEHEIAMAQAFGIFGSCDVNRNDYQSGWDTDQFPNNVPELALAMYLILKGGGLSTGGLNFDAKLRRQSIDPVDLIAAHVGGMDTCARALLAAEAMLGDGGLEAELADRYAGWHAPAARAMLEPGAELGEIADRAKAAELDPQPRSGKQERLETWVNRFV